MGQYAPYGLGLQRAGPEPPELCRRSGQDNGSARADVEDHPGRRARQSERDRPDRQRRLLAYARLEISVRPVEPLRDLPRDAADLGLQRLVDHELAPRRLRDQLDRAVVVRGAEPARYEAELGCEPLGESGLELIRTVADDRDPSRLEPELERLGGEEGAVQVRAFASDELAPRDDDRGPRPRGIRFPARQGRCRRR